MVVPSTYTIDALNVEIFSERVISAANSIMDEGNTSLFGEEREMMVVLRIDREFKKSKHTKNAHVQNDTFNCMGLREDDNETDSEEYTGDEGASD